VVAIDGIVPAPTAIPLLCPDVRFLRIDLRRSMALTNRLSYRIAARAHFRVNW